VVVYILYVFLCFKNETHSVLLGVHNSLDDLNFLDQESSKNLILKAGTADVATVRSGDGSGSGLDASVSSGSEGGDTSDGSGANSALNLLCSLGNVLSNQSATGGSDVLNLVISGVVSALSSVSNSGSHFS